MMTWKKALVTNDDDGVLVLLLIVSMRQPDVSNILFNKEDPLLKIGIAEPLQLLLLLFQYGPHVKNQKRLTVRWVKFFPFFSRVVLLYVCSQFCRDEREGELVKRTSTVRLSLRVWDKHTKDKQFTIANLSRPNCRLCSISLSTHSDGCWPGPKKRDNWHYGGMK